MSSLTTPKRSYNKSKLHSCCKNVLGQLLYSAGEHKPALIQIMKAASYDVPQRTQRRWLRSVHDHGTSLQPLSRSGRHKKLNEEQELLVTGFISSQIENKCPVSNSEVKEFIQHRLGIDLNLRTVQQHSRKLGFSSQKTRTRTRGFKELQDDLAIMYLDFLVNEAHPIFSALPRAKIASIDFTYTTHNHDGVRRLGYQGG